MAHFFKRKLFKKKKIKEKILKRIRLFNVFICRPVSLSPGKHLLPRFFRREIFHKNKFSKFRFSQNIEVIKSKHLVTLKILLHNSSFNRVHMHECIHISRLESLNKSMEAYPLAYLSFQSFENLDIRSILKALRAGRTVFDTRQRSFCSIGQLLARPLRHYYIRKKSYKRELIFVQANIMN